MTPPAASDVPAAVLVLTGGAGRRLGTVDKAALTLGDTRLVDRAIAAALARPVVIVGPRLSVPATVTITREDPPGGGPAAGLAAGAAVLASRGDLDDEAIIAVQAVDQPGVTANTWRRLCAAQGAARAAVLMRDGRRQYGVITVRWSALRTALAQRPSWHGQSLRSLLDPLIDVELTGDEAETRDIDTAADLDWWRARSAADPDR